MPSKVWDGPPRPRPDAGFGLPELMISLVVVSTALVGIAGTAAQVGSGLNSTHERTRALTAAQQQLEILLAAPYDSVDNGAASAEGVNMLWTVNETDYAKEIVLEYRHITPKRELTGTLTTARWN